MLFPEGGVDSFGKGGDKITTIFIVTSDSFLLAATVLFYWWYLHIHLQYFCYVNVFIISIDLIILFCNIYVCCDSFNELCKYIIYNLSSYAGSDLLLCHVVNLVLSSINRCGIHVYCAILFSFKFLLNMFRNLTQ